MTNQRRIAPSEHVAATKNDFEAYLDACDNLAAWCRLACLRCNGTGYERKRPNLPREPCRWCEGTGTEPDR